MEYVGFQIAYFVWGKLFLCALTHLCLCICALLLGDFSPSHIQTHFQMSRNNTVQCYLHGHWNGRGAVCIPCHTVSGGNHHWFDRTSCVRFWQIPVTSLCHWRYSQHPLSNLNTLYMHSIGLLWAQALAWMQKLLCTYVFTKKKDGSAYLSNR